MSRTLGELFLETARRYPHKPAFFHKESGRYRSITWEEAALKVAAAARFLTDQGLRPGDRVAIHSENRPEWALMDLAAQLLGLCTVPIYTSLTPAEVRYILQDSKTKVVAVSQKALFEKISSVQASLPDLSFVIGFDPTLRVHESQISVPLHLSSDVFKVAPEDSLDKMRAYDDPSALASIIYTSGTTGIPKGVMLTHDNFIQNVYRCRETLKMSDTDFHLSFLPLCHVFERTAGHFLMITIGASIAYAESLETVPQNIHEVRPTFLLGVPRFFEKVQSRVLDKVRRVDPLRQGLFLWGKELRRKHRCGEMLSAVDRALEPLADLLVYRIFKGGLGGRIRFCVAGGAPLAKEVAEFFYDLGVMVYEGYGLTETSPVISVNLEGRWRFGSVGIPLKGVEVRITPDGEIATKSPCVMKGYLNKPEETAEVLRDGWFYTGDLGRFDRDGFLFITGRKKELLVTSGGKKISPRPIEELLEKDPYVLRCVLAGDGKKYINALIVPRRDALLGYAQDQKMSFGSYADLLKDKKIMEFLDARFQEAMKELASYEKVKYFVLVENDFTQAAGELTPTLKVKREVVLSRHRDALDALYSKE